MKRNVQLRQIGVSGMVLLFPAPVVIYGADAPETD